MSKRSEQAEMIINSSLFQESFEEMKNECYSKWLASGTAEEREELHREVKTIVAFQTKLEVALSEGIIEQTIGGNHDD